MGYRPRGFDHIGTLRSRLGDLQGFATLAYELVQNAEDAGAAWLRFDVRHDGLSVDNGSVFSSCGQLVSDPCPQQPTCDFHRFANIGSGDKRLDPNTIGAFGIGFLSVYQITDHPELISAGEHWRLDELALQDQRIHTCEGCELCQAPDLPGTRFLFPFADTETRMRREIGFEPVSVAQVDALVERLRAVLPEALLFLHNVQQIELRRDGNPVLSLECLREADRVVMTADASITGWQLFEGTVDDAHLAALQHTVGDEGVRRDPRVNLAVGDHLHDGLFFSWLPTQERVGLPFHLNADFFPTNDRKRLLWDSDYRSTWNRACLEAAASTLADRLSDIRDELGAARLWQLLVAARDRSSAAERGVFWRSLLPEVQSGPFVYTDDEDWATPSEVVLLGGRFRNHADVISHLGIKSVHVELEPHRNTLTDQHNGAGVLQLQLRHILSAWRALESQRATGEQPDTRMLDNEDLRRQLWETLEALLEQAPLHDREALTDLEVLLTNSGTPVAPATGRTADTKTRRLFNSLDVVESFVELPVDKYPRLAQLVPDWSVLDAIEALEDRVSTGTNAGSRIAPHVELLRWFNARREQVLDGDLVNRLAALPLFPTAGELAPLSRLSLPSNFSDPLRLASLVDLTEIGDCQPLLAALGAKALDVFAYVEHHVVPAICKPNADDRLKRAAVRFLADNPSSHKQGVLSPLTSIEIIPCEDGTLSLPRECFLHSDELELLAERPRLAVVPAERRDSTLLLYTTLGVRDRPGVTDLIQTAEEAVSSPPTARSIRRVSDLFAALANRSASEEVSDEELQALQVLAWLPSEGDERRWYKAGEVAAVFQKHVFASQARFLGLPRPLQNAHRPFLDVLGVQTSPKTDQIVDHVLSCSERSKPIHADVYRRLNERATEPALSRLRDTACIYIEGQGFWRPDHVFWNEHGFGRFRLHLAHELGAYDAFLTEVGVSPDGPDHDSAIDMLEELANQPDLSSRPLSPDELGVVRYSWRLLSKALAQDRLTQEELSGLAGQRVAPDAGGHLNRPDLLFFADRGGLADAFSETLSPNIIPIDPDTRAGMEAAGVRRISAAAELELLDVGDRTRSDTVMSRLHERRLEIERVLGTDSRSLSGLLDSLSVERARPISVRYSVRMQGRSIPSPEQEPLAVSLTAEGVILVDADDNPPWPQFARELAGYLKEDDAAPVASGLHQALAPQSRTEATTLLDTLGFPTIDDQPTADIVGAEAGRLGTLVGHTEDPTTQDPVGAAATPPPASPPPSPSGGDAPAATRPRAFKRSRYVTYVAPPGTPTEPQGDEERASFRAHIAAAGVAVAMEHEKQNGREPVEMPPNNKGYDLESKDADGKVRSIEVKGLSGAWGSDGVGMTAPEFNTARDREDSYWLYVVEYADTEEAVLHRIRNPARMVNRFFFDHGWRGVAQTVQGESTGDIPAGDSERGDEDAD